MARFGGTVPSVALPAVVGLLVVLAAGGLAPARAAEEDVAALLAGVSTIAAPGAPGSLCVYGQDAFPVVVGQAGRDVREAVVAAARWGRGRCVAFGHDGYFSRDALQHADTGKLVENALRWASGDADPRVAVHQQPELLDFLKQLGLTAQPLDGPDWWTQLGGFTVLCLHPNAVSGPEQAAAIATFLTAGGGLLAADTGWGWLQLHSGMTLAADHPGNRLLAPAGLAWTDVMLRRTSPAGFDTTGRPDALAHAGLALDALQGQGARALSKEDLAQASAVLTTAARNLPIADETLRPRLGYLRDRYAADAVPGPDSPLGIDRPLVRLALTLQLDELISMAPEKITAHPAAELFPGPVPADAPRVTRTVSVDTRVPAWHSTGLYAAPGEVIEVRVPDAAADQGLSVRIGAHSDRLWSLDSWRRAPDICRRDPLRQPVTRTAGAFGGLIYIEVRPGSRLGPLDVEIAGAVEAPHFVLGKVDPAQWRAEVRTRPAPWAELETRKVVLTLPSTTIRHLEDPVELMELWDHVLDSCAELVGRPLDRPRPERYVTDVQISAGYMHSAYPIMTHLDVAPLFVDRRRIMSNGHLGVWGFFHEMGHNHQSGDWTFGGAGEVTVNLFTLYVFDKVLGNMDNAHPAFTPEARAKKLREYLAGGPGLDKWSADPFLGLIMYLQLRQAFGWDAYKRVFAEYRDLPDHERPRTDDDKRDQWMVRFSRTVGRNLGPFFQAWGIPASEQARASIADLPPWMPADWPTR